MAKIDNDNHELFCHRYIELGQNGTKAYMSVYPDADEESAKASASRLLTNVNVKSRIEELQKENYKQSLLNTKGKMDWLVELLSTKNEDVKINSQALKLKMEALDMLNKMTGEYTQKMEVKNNIKVNPYDNLSAEDIKELLKHEPKS